MSPSSDQKLYNTTAVGVATYLGGPLAAGVMVRNNFLKFGQPKQAKQALWAGLGLTIVVFSLIAMMPPGLMEKIPNYLIPGIYTAGIVAWVRAQMGERLAAHESQNGEFYSGWKTFGVGLLGLVTTLIIGLSIIMLAPPTSGEVKLEAAWTRVVENETKANEFYTLANKEGVTDEELLKNLDETVIPLWDDSAQVVKEMEALPWLDSDNVKKTAALKGYVALQQEKSALVRRVLTEGGDGLKEQIEAVNKKLEGVVLDAK